MGALCLKHMGEREEGGMRKEIYCIDGELRD